ncbi:MAG TPA: GNAT family N-acetyltransferase [Nitrososphaera sp.]|nr:GNAT family N-acetyltransferase [Nitrososphaera sp.]
MIDLNKLVFASFSRDDNFATLDFTEADGSDPLGVDDFIRNRARLYLSNNLCAIYTVRYAGQIVAYFTASMSAIETKRLVDEDKVPNVGILSYPALLMGQMAVDKKYRGQGIGYWICEFCVGLAQEMNNKVGCALVILQTNKDKLEYYKKKCGFKHSEKQSKEGKVWMYKRIF